ncbi:MAG: hypothetical protein P8M73_02855 [Luminiphilus sp.]|jgi:hypothetical protein|nr:hypothetical protein [Luminiphilus sp.]
MRFLMVVFALMAVTAQAQEYEARSEFMYCNLNEDKTLEDVIAQSERYGAYSKEAGSQYLQAILTPMHAGLNNPYDYVIWGQWPDGQSMYNEWGSYVNGYWKWMAEQNEPVEAAGTCRGVIAMFNAATAHNRIPADERDKWQPYQWADCTLKEGVTMQDVMVTQARHGELMKAAGFEGWGRHVFMPYLGFEPDWAYDYVQMNHWYTFEHRGKTADTWLAFLESHPEVQEESEALASCERDRSYAGRLIFDNTD